MVPCLLEMRYTCISIRSECQYTAGHNILQIRSGHNILQLSYYSTVCQSNRSLVVNCAYIRHHNHVNFRNNQLVRTTQQIMIGFETLTPKLARFSGHIYEHVNNIPIMQLFTGISRNTQSKSYYH